MAIEYLFFGLVLCLTIVGIPFGLQVVKLSSLAIWPFGREAVQKDKSDGCLKVIMNIIWSVLGGFEIAVTHAILGLVFFITIIGIPFGKQHFKLASIALTPFGREIVPITSLGKEIVGSKRVVEEDGVSISVNIVNNVSNNTSPEEK